MELFTASSLATNQSALPSRPLLGRTDWYWMAGVFGLYMLYLPFSGYTEQYYDALTYWGLPSRFITPDRHFSLLHYSANTRGYSWPLLLAPWRTAWKVLGGDPMWYIRTLGSMVAALCYGWLGPRLWQTLRNTSQEPGPVARLAFVLTGFVFWRDHFNFALSDFPTLVFVGTALILAGRGLLVRPAELRWWGELVRWLIVGAFLGLAYNARGIYLLSLYPMLLAAAWPTTSGITGLRSSTSRLAALLLGLGLILLPQYLMIRRFVPEGSPWHLSGVQQQDELVKRHLSLGLGNFKYEATIGNDYPEVRVWFQDPLGQYLMQRHGITSAGMEPATYAKLVRQYPLEFCTLLTQRLFNGLDLQQPTPYLRQVYPATWPLAWANYTVLGLGLLVLGRLFWQARRLPLRRLLLVAALLLPVIGALPVAVETRFMLPLHFGLCMAATLGFPAAWHPAQLRRSVRPAQGLLLAALYLGWLLLAFTFSAYSQIHLQLGGRLLGGSS
ncbi:hypothetical protein SAMN06265337_2489 [Hymenobacter gelipurpurascens]|uniref:Dolichyl-phosphate-mannose-protein mannosyltransferase n=1 Tax=Hymenobacter gelipurpurascens TaxID=89968 RepID=A0A212U9E5_9BACT|nr:hypothetical protein [Hymenobacter gelipurpurascens]SNC74674.1 hypothetical protein SAMN06265337_2489 [Hymenobacter gelipurpurascens]